jgi:HK97 family phage portal protein
VATDLKIRERIAAVWQVLTGKAGPPGYNAGSAYGGGGSAWVDYFRTRRAPLPTDLVEAYKGLCYACTDKNANGVARVPLRLYATTGSGQGRPKCLTRPVTKSAQARLRSTIAKAARADEIEEVIEHPLLDLMAEVNQDFDHNFFLQYLSRCLDVVGAAYALPEFGRLRTPVFLWPLLAQYVQAVTDPSGSTVTEYRYQGQTYLPDDLIRFRFVSLRNPYAGGYSPTQAAFAYVGLSDQYVSVQENLLSQGVRPSAIISPKDPNLPFGKEERRRIEAEANQRFSGGGSGHLWAVDGALDVHPLTFPPSDLAELQISDNAFLRVCNTFGVPISLFSQDTNLANLQAAHRAHAELAIEPRCVLIASALTKWTRTQGRKSGLGWDRLFWAFDNPVQEERELNAQVHDTYIRDGVLTIDEVRAELGYGPTAWGNEPWVPGSLVQPSSTIGEREQNRAAALPDERDEGPGEVGVVHGTA